MNFLSNGQDDPQRQKLIQLFEDFLHPDRWGFQLATTSTAWHSTVIYDSQWCRVQATLSRRDLYGGDDLSIFYGRLHAPDDKAVMLWRGEQCYCWHRINEALHYLDGLSPRKAWEESHRHQRWPQIMEQFRQSEIGKRLGRNQPEWLARMHASVWEHYGKTLFELFDMRRPDLWEKYREFLEMYYEIKGRISDLNPPEDKVC